MLQKTIQRTLPGLVAALLALPGGACAQAAMERLSRVKHLDRAKLSESQWNVGLQGAGVSRETATEFGLYTALGVELVLGPGSGFFQLGIAWSDLAGRITGDSNTGNLSPALGYRLML